MSVNFTYDMYKFRKHVGTMVLQSPEETFRLKSGVCYDAAYLAKDVLNKINPEYQARVIFLHDPKGPPHHFVTGFKMNGKIYIIDYGTPERQVTGVHGPYDFLEEYRKFYIMWSKQKSIDGVIWYD